MKVNKTEVNILAADTANVRAERKAVQKSNNDKKNNLYAGNLNLQNDTIAQKRKEARKEAMKIIGDAFKGDRKLDDDIKRRLDNIDALKNEITNSQKEISKLDANKKEMKEAYGITDDSQEQLDLELLEKRRASRKDPTIRMSEEEKQRLAIIDKAGMTEYQKFSLEMDALKEPFQKIIKDSQKIVNNEAMTINGIKLERLKTHPMVDANVAADKILDAASEEILGLLIDEAKDHIEEEMEEQKEAAERQAEEKQEQEEKTVDKSSSVHNGAAENNTVELILALDEIKNDVQKEVLDIIDKMKLLPEDIIGAVVDTSV